MIFPDYHVHSSFSSDCEADINDIIRCAKENGLTSLCITDHYDMDFPVQDENDPMNFYLDIPKYLAAYKAKRDEVKDSFDLRIGVELGIMNETIDKLHDLMKTLEGFDFVIASSHLVDGLDPYYPEYFEGKTEKDAYHRYFESILEIVSSYNDYNVYGHIDYILRYGPNQAKFFNINDYKDVLAEALETIIENGKGIEINTASYRRKLNFAHPHPEILKLYKDLGGEIITIGSDAHRPHHVGRDFDKAKQLLIDTGFKYYTTFKNQKPEFELI